MMHSKLLQMAGGYYSQKMREHGPSYKGVDWASEEGQVLRFDQLLRCCDPTVIASINDYGCGYGALLEYLTLRGFRGSYRGFDISEEMITCASEIYRGRGHRALFTADETQLAAADYTFASGIFNIKLDAAHEEWTEYVLYVLEKIAALSKKGFVFNVLSAYTHPDSRSDDLYYANPFFFFDYCKRQFSAYVVLLHDYPLNDFTLCVTSHPHHAL